MALIISTWRWGHKYPQAYVERLFAGVRRNLATPHELLLSTPPPDDPLIGERGCFTRLRTFDPAWQAANGIAPGDRIVCLDLDMVVTGPLDALFDSDEPFTILQRVNASNPCPYNGSVWMLRAGYRPDVWTDFSLEAAAAVPHFEFPDDQAWLARKLPGAAAFGPDCGVYAFAKPGWPAKTQMLPPGARLVAFPGWRDPSAFRHLPWIQEHWAA